MSSVAHRRPARHRPRAVSQRALLYVVLAVLAFVTAVPILLVLSTALSTPGYGIATHLFPHNLTFANITGAIGPAHIPRLFANSLLITAASTCIVVAFASLAAYGFVQHPFPGSRIVMFVLLATIMLTSASILIPLYHVLITFHLLNNYLGLILPYSALGLPVAVLLFRNAFLAVPRELAEAARIDGAAPLRVYWRIFMPIAKPTIATVVILQVLLAWNDYILALLVMTSKSLATVQLAYITFSSQFNNQFEKQFATLALITVPVIVVFVLFQRQFISGLTGGAVKE